MSEIDDVESTLKLKLEHLFNPNGFIDIFQTIFDALKAQQSKIVELQDTIVTYDDKFKKVKETIRTLEYNIQGYDANSVNSEHHHHHTYYSTPAQSNVEDAVSPLISAKKRTKRKKAPKPKPSSNLAAIDNSAIPSPDFHNDTVAEPTAADQPNDTQAADMSAIVTQVTSLSEAKESGSLDQEQDHESESENDNLSLTSSISTSEISSINPFRDRTPEEEARWQLRKKTIIRNVKYKLKMIAHMKTEMAKRKVAVSQERLDPKMSVHSRIDALEHAFDEMKEIVGANRRALSAMPARIREVVPSDLKAKLERLAKVMSKLEEMSDEKEEVLKKLKLEQDSQRKEFLQALAKLQQGTPRPQITNTTTTNSADATAIPSHLIDSKEFIDAIVKQLKEGGHLNQQAKATTQAPISVPTVTEICATVFAENVGKIVEIVQDNTQDFMTKGDLLTLFESPPIVENEANTDDASKPFNHQNLNYLQRKSLAGGHDNLSKTGNSNFSDKLKHALAVQHRLLIANLVDKTEFTNTITGINNLISAEIMKLDKAKSQMIDELLRPYSNKINKLEASILDVKDMIETLESTMKTNLEDLRSNSEAYRQDSLNSNFDSKPWRPDLIKVVENIKSATDEQNVANRMLVKELENMRREIRNRVSEGRVEEMIGDIQENVNRVLGQNLDGVQVSVAKIAKAIKNKADYQSIEKLIIERIAEAEDALKHSMEKEDSGGAAGTFRCISCGSNSGFVGMKQLQDRSLEIPNVNQSTLSSIQGDKDQIMAVINRQAGLKPLNLHYQPLRPRSHTGSRRPPLETEPLYRKAKFANSMKEVPKVPPSHQPPPEKIYIDDYAVAGLKKTMMQSASVNQLPVILPQTRQDNFSAPNS